MNFKSATTVLFLFLSLILKAQPANDEPCNAIDIDVNTSCVTSSFTNNLATNSAGIPNPLCANYLGGDVWFKFVMPNNGYHTVIELLADEILDGGMAVYSGSNCNSLSLIACDDDSGTGAMPIITIDDGCGFADASNTFWIRVWEDGNDENGAFGICAYGTPPPAPPATTTCGPYPPAGNSCCDAPLLTDDLDGFCGNTNNYTDMPDELAGEFCAFIDNNVWVSFIASDTMAVIGVEVSNCNFGNGLQGSIFQTDDCLNFTAVSNCWNPGVEFDGSLVGTGLTIGEIYYVMLDGWAQDICDYELSIISGVQTTEATTTDAEICMGESVALNAEVIGFGDYTYAWTPAASLDDATSSAPMASPTVTTDYIVTVTGGINTIIDTVTITVFDAAPTQPTITGTQMLCQNTNNVVYHSTANSAETYDWTVTGGATIVGPANLDSLVVDWGMTGGSVCLVASNDCGDSPQACITVTATVQPDITAVNPATVCAPNTIDLNNVTINNASGVNGTVTFYSTQADAEMATAPISNTVNTSGTYWIRMETGADCFDVTSVTVTIENPTLTVIDPAPICSPNTVDLDGVIINEDNGLSGTKSFYTTSADANNATNPMTDLVVTSGGTYYVRYETANNCSVVAPINVSIELQPDITVVQPPMICSPGQIDLDTVTMIDANGTTIVKKDFYNSSALASLNIPAFALNPTTVSCPGGDASYWVRVETAGGCSDIKEIIVTCATPPTGELIGGATVCAGDAIDITFDMTGIAPWEVTYTVGMTPFTLTGIADGHMESITVNNSETITLTSVADGSGCPGSMLGNPIQAIVNTPTASISGTTSICESDPASLTFNFTGGGPFDIVYQDDLGNPTPLNNINDGHSITINPMATTTYTLVSVADVNNCPGTVSGSATITVAAPLQTVNLLETCVSPTNNYTVSFDITGGDVTSYLVSGVTGTLTGSSFVSDELTSGTAYSITITDASGCPQIVLDGSKTCTCSTDAGTMNTTPLEVCEGDMATATHNGDELLETNDLIEFVLHDNPGLTLGTVLASNSTPTFGLGNGTAGTTYYISAIAGPDNGSGGIDLTAACFTVAAGTPVIFIEPTVATINGSAAICSGASTDLTFNFVGGTAPFDVEYSDGTTTMLLEDISNGHVLPVMPTANTDYIIISVTDNTDATCAGTFSGTAMVTINSAVTVTNITETCAASNMEYTVSFELNGGDPSTYAVTGGTGTITGNVFTSDPIATGAAYSFTATDANLCSPADVAGMHECLCTLDAGTMVQTMIDVCGAGTATAIHNGDEVLIPGELFGFVLHDASGTSLGTVLATNNTPDFTFQAPMTFGTVYYISAIAGPDDGSGNIDDTHVCFDVAAGTPVRFIEQTVATLSGDASVCAGDNFDLTFNFVGGTAPFDIEYTDGSATFQLDDIVDGHTETLVAGTSTLFEITSVVDNTGTACAGTFNGSANITVNEAVTVSNLTEPCDLPTSTYTVSFEINGGDAASYAVTGDAGTITGNTFTSDPIASGVTYNFTVTDANMCEPVLLSGVKECLCPTDAGTMNTMMIEVCEGETVTAIHNNNAVLEAGDVIEFILHDASGTTLGNVLATNTIPEFSFLAGMTLGTTYYISPIAGPADVNGNVDQSDPCAIMAAGTPVRFIEGTTATISGDVSVCPGADVNLVFSFSGGEGPFDVTITGGTTDLIFEDLVDGSIETISADANATYTILNVQDNTAATCVGTASGSATVTLLDSPIAGPLTFTCEQTNSAFQVSFEITGGDPSTYQITGGTGTLDPATNIFTSALLPSGANYLYEISDNGSCDSYIVEGDHVCPCTSNAGTMALDLQVVCGDGSVTAVHNNDEILDSNDAIGFVLHDESGAMLGNVIATSSSTNFAFDNINMNYGVIYFVSAVVANDDGTGFPVDDLLQDACLSVAMGQPVVFHEIPEASIMLSGMDTLCLGEETTLTFNIIGSGTFDVAYGDGVDTIELFGINPGHIETVTPQIPTTYTLLSVIAANTTECPGIIDPMQNTVDVYVKDFPMVNNFEVTCNDDGTEYRISFEITGGDPSTYMINGDAGSLVGNVFTSEIYLSGATYNFEVSDSIGCPPTILTATEYCNCGPDILISMNVTNEISCFGEADGGLVVQNINGEAPFDFQWSNLEAGTNIDDLTVGWYAVTMTDANNCIRVDSIFLNEPSAVGASLIGTDVSCFGDDNGLIEFDNVQGGSGGYMYSIDGEFPSAEPYYERLDAGIYTANIIDSDGCTWSDTITINEPDEFEVDLGGNVIIGLGDSLMLQPLANRPIDTFYWEYPSLLPCSDCLNPMLHPTNEEIHQITAFDENGCESTDFITVTIAKERLVYIPTAFSPNGDGSNDRFTIYAGNGVEKIEDFNIFNRWGEQVFEQKELIPGDESLGWDGRLRGKKMLPDVYVYFAKVTFVDGRVEIYTGDITIMR